MKVFYLAIGIFTILGIAYVAWIVRKASKLDFVHYPKEGIDMCALCQHEYPTRQLESELRTLEQAARMGVSLPGDFWNRFCCDAMRNKLKTKYRETSAASLSTMLSKIDQQTKDR